MSQLFTALKTIRDEREAAVHEYARVAARARGSVPMPASPPRRWSRGMISGVIGFAAGITVALFATTAPHGVSQQAQEAVAVTAPARPTSDAHAANAGAIVMTAVAGNPSQNTPAEARADEDRASEEFWVQVGAFKFRENAVRMRARLEGEGRNAVIRPGPANALPWVIAVGPYADEGTAHDAELALADQGVSGFVVRGDQ
jgi:cell division septation protein DedD